MKTIYRESKKIFDGTHEELKNPVIFYLSGISHTIIPGKLEPISKIEFSINVDPKGISKSLGLPITHLGKLTIYKGSMSGLKLHYSVEGDRALIFSFGEYQPGRFICVFESIHSA